MNTPQPVYSSSAHVHKRQRLWQILVPFLVFTGLILALASLFASKVIPSTPAWADVSIIWLIIPMLVFALLFLAVLVFLIYAIAKLLQGIPRFTGKIQDFLTSISGWTRKITDGIASPVIWFNQAGAVIKSIFNKP